MYFSKKKINGDTVNLEFYELETQCLDGNGTKMSIVVMILKSLARI